jgi:hypothetical protein
MPLYKFLHNLLNILAQVANKVGFQKTSANPTMSQVYTHLRTYKLMYFEGFLATSINLAQMD